MNFDQPQEMQSVFTRDRLPSLDLPNNAKFEFHPDPERSGKLELIVSGNPEPGVQTDNMNLIRETARRLSDEMGGFDDAHQAFEAIRSELENRD